MSEKPHCPSCKCARPRIPEGRRSLAEVFVEQTAEITRLREQCAELAEALRPFADFADPISRAPHDAPITRGSTTAKRQLTMGHCYAARRATLLFAPETPSEDTRND